METNFINLFKQNLIAIFNRTSASELELYPDNFTYDFVEEYTNRNDVDCLVIIKQLTPTFQHDVKNIPYQIMIECNNKYIELLKKDLDELALEMDATTLGGEHYFLSGVAVLSTFIDKGLYQATALTMNVNVIVASNIVEIKNLKIEGKNVDVLNFGFSYAGNPDVSGALSKNGKVEASMLNATVTYTFTILPTRNKLDLIKDMLKCNNINKSRSLSFELDDETINVDALLVNGGIAKPLESIATLQLTFMVKEW